MVKSRILAQLANGACLSGNAVPGDPTSEKIMTKMCENGGSATLLQGRKKSAVQGKNPQKLLRRKAQSASMRSLSQGRKIGAEIKCIQFQYTNFRPSKHARITGSLRIPMACPAEGD